MFHTVKMFWTTKTTIKKSFADDNLFSKQLSTDKVRKKRENQFH